MLVTVKGLPDPDTGYVMNMKDLGKIMKEHIVDKVDHKNLNLDVDFLKDKMTSCETLAMEFWKILAPKVKGLLLIRSCIVSNYMKLERILFNITESNSLFTHDIYRRML